ncbi:unnamed protein product [Paramecium pentaurelia]|uniref:Uncharacterized protein n=1 Tax=Paramecium pentaurelia TaxID=43138 RepID=A0A8S1UG76_9CILI|nr:unnamed protein product [Paramecium pentaurelia]
MQSQHTYEAIIKHYEQPIDIATIMCPEEYSSIIFQLCEVRNGKMVGYRDIQQIRLIYIQIPFG